MRAGWLVVAAAFTALIAVASVVLVGDTGATVVPDRETGGDPRAGGGKNVAIFIHEGVELLDFSGPGEVFRAAGHGSAFRVYTVAASARPVTSGGFVTVTPEYTFANCPRPDVLVIPGGQTELPLGDPATIEWITKTSRDAEVTLSVCTGAFLLAKAGLLDGRGATTHWSAIDELRDAAPKARVVGDVRYVDSGRVVTAAGVSAGIDGSLHVVERLLGPAAARETARYMDYRWDGEPDGRTGRRP